MINLGSLFQRLFDLVNKDQSGGTYTPTQMNTNLPYVLYKYLKVKYGLPEQPGAPQAFEIVQKITDDIKELKEWMGGPNTPMLGVNGKGRASFPSDYWHPASMFYIQSKKDSCDKIVNKTRRIEIVTEDERVFRLSDPLTGPTMKNPICCLYSDFMQFYPIGIPFVHFTYLRKPETPFFDYDIDADDAVVFLPVGTVHQNNSVMPAGTPSRTVELPLPDDAYEDVVNILLADYGLTIRDAWPYQAGERRKVVGN